MLDEDEIVDVLQNAIRIITHKVRSITYEDVQDIVYNYYAYKILNRIDIQDKTPKDLLNIILKVCLCEAIKLSLRKNRFISISNDENEESEAINDEHIQLHQIKEVDMKMDIEIIMDNVSEGNKVLFELLNEGYSINEISEQLGIKPKTLYQRKSREIIRLQKKLGITSKNRVKK